MIEGMKDLDVKPKDTDEEIDRKIQEKLGITLAQITDVISKSMVIEAEVICEELMNIAPYGKYEELMEEIPDMVKFLKEECVKPESWRLHSISDYEGLVRFTFYSKAVDDGDALKGFAFVNCEGKITHGFARSDV